MHVPDTVRGASIVLVPRRSDDPEIDRKLEPCDGKARCYTLPRHLRQPHIQMPVRIKEP